MKNKTVCVIGLGYIGLPTSALLANNGYRVFGVDIDIQTVDTINKGQIHIVEPELDKFVSSAVENKLLTASLDPSEADVFMIAVPTPFHKEKKNKKTDSPVPNIDYIVTATKNIAPFIRSGNLILLESTSPVGTTEKIESILKDYGVDTKNIYIAHSPERVLPGNIMRELIENDRIVGGINHSSMIKAAEFYKTFVKGDVLETNARTAEMAKLAENSYRDVNIAFANELSMLCDDMDINVRELISLANKHPRVDILNPGCGVGGHCISVDPWFIVDSANGKAKLIEQARRTNNYKANWVVKKIKNIALEFENTNGRKPTIACMGLSFKPNIDDLRESPALNITQKLIDLNLNILAVEPNIELYENINIVDYNTATQESDILVFLVAHKEFNKLDLINKKIIDFSGIIEQS